MTHLAVAKMGVEADGIVGPEADRADAETGRGQLDLFDQAAAKAQAADAGIKAEDTQGHAARVPPEGECAADDAAPVLDDEHEGTILGEATGEIREPAILVGQSLWQLRADDVEGFGQLVE
jgi:hypothetical protein